MDKSCHSSGDSSISSISTANTTAAAAAANTTTTDNTLDAAATTSSNNNNNRDQFLRHLNKLSHKISKPTTAIPPSLIRRPPAEPPVHHRPPPLQQQPPVYNINKSDFRDVVQKLTGSPAHDRIQSPAQPPPIHAPKPASSRLQRIRPPPLAQLSNRPPPILNCAIPNPANSFIRQVAPLSPLPPLPSCHAAAESPISAYMRFLHSTTSIATVDSDPKLNNNRMSPINPHQMLPPPQINHPPTSADTSAPPPSSPLPFGCLPSPKSPCPLLSPNLLFSPTGTGPLGFPPLPISPGVPSPKWRDL